MAKLKELDKIIRFGTKVRIIEQITEVFADHEKDKVVYETKATGYQYGEFRYIEKYANYKVCMISQDRGFVEIYIWHPVAMEDENKY